MPSESRQLLQSTVRSGYTAPAGGGRCGDAVDRFLSGILKWIQERAEFLPAPYRYRFTLSLAAWFASCLLPSL